MGTGISVVESQFEIGEGDYDEFLKICESYNYVYNEERISCNRWEFFFNDNDNDYNDKGNDSPSIITDIDFGGENSWDSFDFLKQFAHIVKEDSYIEILYNDGGGDRERWVFKNGKIEVKTPKIVWD